jgi:hypothetical protein
MAFYNIEPFGAEFEAYRAGKIAATVANFSGNLKKGLDPLKSSDFFPELLAGPTPPPPDVAAQIKSGFAGFTIVRPADRDAARKAAARPPKRKRG